MTATGRRFANVRVGCAGWSLPREHQSFFPHVGSHLSRYAEVLPAVEVNSSFYRHHRESTYRRWADSVPNDFRFSVKMSKEITHETRLRLPPLLDEFLVGPLNLGDKLGPLLIQLPPSLTLEVHVAGRFFASLRDRYQGSVVCEPRHASWFTDEADALLESHQIDRVGADPSPAPGAAAPGAWSGVTYYRLHGAPKMYYSAYDDGFLGDLARHLSEREGEVWCIFDNTARSAAIPNALRMLELLGESPGLT